MSLLPLLAPAALTPSSELLCPPLCSLLCPLSMLPTERITDTKCITCTEVQYMHAALRGPDMTCGGVYDMHGGGVYDMHGGGADMTCRGLKRASWCRDAERQSDGCKASCALMLHPRPCIQ